MAEQLTTPYASWVMERQIDRRIAAGAHNHFFSVIVFDQKDSVGSLDETIRSIEAQTYRNFELVLGVQRVPGSRMNISEYDSRGVKTAIGLKHMELLCSPHHDVMWRGDHVMFVPVGTTLDGDCLELVNAALNNAGHEVPDLVVIDHDHPGLAGSDPHPVFVPGWDPDLVQHLDIYDAAFVASRQLVVARRGAGEASSLHDWLKAIGRERRQPVTAHVSEPAVHFAHPGPQGAGWRPVDPLPWERGRMQDWPRLAIIIPNRDKPELMRLCTGFLDRSPRFRPEIIVVDNESSNAETLAIYERLEQRHGAKVVSAGPVFNYSRSINLGVSEAQSDFILLMNNDVEFSRPGQIEQLLLNAMRPEVGIAGSLLLYPDERIQHAGMQFGLDSAQRLHAGHALRGGRLGDVDPIYPVNVPRNHQAVTGAVQAMRREVFEAAGGYDEANLPIDYNDVDICLRVREMGLRVISLPLAGVYHHEGVSRTGRKSIPPAQVAFNQAAAVMDARWHAAAERDPCCNPWLDVRDLPDVRTPWGSAREEAASDRAAGAAGKDDGEDGQVESAAVETGGLRWAMRHPKKALARLTGPSRHSGVDAAPEIEPDAAPGRTAGEATSRAAGDRKLRSGLAVYGYFQSEVGLGQAARNIMYAGDSAHLPVSACNLSLERRDNDPEFVSKSNSVSSHQASMVVIDLLGAEPTKTRMAAGRYNILYPFWELGRIPRRAIEEIGRFDEIWAPSSFVARALGSDLKRPIELLRQPVRLPASMPAAGRRDGTLRIYTFFDFDSFVERKDPASAVQAFRRAFSDNRRDVELLLKARGGRDESQRKWLLDAVAADPRIRFVDRTLSRAEADGLMAQCDVFISLHRSEGFGFGCAEALAAGKAVVATDFGGTTDFINEETGYPVPYDLRPVGPNEYADFEGQTWAAASVEAAAEALRAIYDDPQAALQRTRRGFDLLLRNHSPQRVGEDLKGLLGARGLL
ncbi:MAG: glycosyltransferase [Rhodobiaceae bacterium]|nr:glycosyltransferase [Rhodobiaceae bacterium]MCC0053105.1 glycosyltransferase [Rhodobiaceae bacterium]